MNLLEQYNKNRMEMLVGDKKIPDFKAGDTLKVFTKIKEGANERIQIFEGVCLGKHNKGVASNFIVKKMSSGYGVERMFPLYSPHVEKVEVLRRGRVRRAKIYYMRSIQGKAARIKEIVTFAPKDKTAK